MVIISRAVFILQRLTQVTVGGAVKLLNCYIDIAIEVTNNGVEECVMKI